MKDKNLTESSSTAGAKPVWDKIPDRPSEKELRVLIEHNREIIRTFKAWANANSYETACAAYAKLRKLVGADDKENVNEAEGHRSSGETEARDQ